MHFLLLKDYNNYYNRIYKREVDAEFYKEAVSFYVEEVDKSVNFNINDGINMQHIFNCVFSGEPNYLLLLNEDDDSINSRWFVIEWRQIRGNQFEATLRRDLLADNYQAITTAPSFIEKGYVDPTDSAIFNHEDMTFNQIKIAETSLKDTSNTAWIVGYVAQDHTEITNAQFTVNPDVDVTYSGNHTDWIYSDLVDGNEHITINENSPENQMRFLLHWVQGFSGYQYEFMFNKTGGSSYVNNTPRDHWEVDATAGREYERSNWINTISWTTCMEKLHLDDANYVRSSDYEALLGLVGKNLQFNDGVYTVTLTSSYDGMESNWTYKDSGNLYNYLYGVVNSNVTGGIRETAYYPVAYKLNIKRFRFTLTPVTNISGVYHYDIPQATKKLQDAPYKMFAIPYYTGGQVYRMSVNGTTNISVYKDIQLAWAMSMINQLQNQLYDIQILPYCPISNWVGRTTYDGIYLKNNVLNVDITQLKDTNNLIVGYCSWCDVSSHDILLDSNTYKAIVTDYKMANETEFFRLCSPNYASAFEFSPAKNGGVTGYNVRFTYKPYQPFINVAPIFNRLYGRDYKDNRGLILAGDFSLPVISDAWKQYQLNNKNYQLAFDRQIENMEVNYGWQKAMGIANAITGSVQGATSGAMTGGLVGGVPGAIAGGIVGGASAIGGGIADVAMQQALHNEAIDFAKDQFGYQLGNIKALPNTLNKVSSLVATSKLFPFVEQYSCTAEERQALRDKIKYNGMSIGRIGTIEDFLNPNDQTYVKGQLIRLEGKYDTHTVNEIANEFMKGWYI